MPLTKLLEDALVLPTSSQATRPTAEAGMVRHNSTTGSIEYYDTTAAAWLQYAPFSATAPSSPAAGQMWFDTTANVYKEWNATDSIWYTVTNAPLDGSTEARAAQYGSEIIALKGGSFTAGRYWLTGKTSSGQSPQQVYVDADGWMLFFRMAGTGGTYNSTYEFIGDNYGEDAIGTLYSPSQGLTDTGSSTSAGSRGVARLSTAFVRALGGENAATNVIWMNCGGTNAYITDAQWYATAASTAPDNFGYDSSISYGSSYAGRRTYTGYATGETARPLGTYPGNIYTIPYYHGNGFSGGYNGGWHVSTTIYVREY